MSDVKFNIAVYQNVPQLVLGFHGCDEENAKRVLEDPRGHLYTSRNDYDWLGDGIYFWLNDPQRAYEWAVERSKSSKSNVKKPAVIGAVIDLGVCMNLCERESIMLLQKSYQDLEAAAEEAGLNIQEEFQNKVPDAGGFSRVRYLDCIVIRHAHDMIEEEGRSFDTVYGYFQEGGAAYPGSDIREKSHIQIAVRNLNCIKGYFLPRLE